MRAFSSLLGVVFAGLLVGCGAGAGSETPTETTSGESSEAVQPSEVSLLEDFEVQGIQYTFMDVDGQVGLVIRGPMGVPAPTLTAGPGTGALTMLEIYQALQPDQVPNPMLVVSQADEAQALGRPDASVIPVKIATTEEKQSVSDFISGYPNCWTALRTGAGFTGTENVDWDHTGATVNSSQNWELDGNHNSKFAKISGICNGFATPATFNWNYAVDTKQGFGPWVDQFGPIGVSPGFYLGWIMAASSTAFRTRIRVTAEPTTLAYLDIVIVERLHN